MPKFLANADFSNLELYNVRLQNLASDPSSPSEGWVYVNTVSHTLKFYDGTTWVSLGTGAGTVTSVSATAGGLLAVTGTSADPEVGIAAMAANTFIANLTGGSAVPTAVTVASVQSALGISGTNTGDQTITLTGDVTGSGTGSFAATVSAGAISLSKMANLAANSIIGNNTGSPATPIALTTSQVKTLLAIVPGDISGFDTQVRTSRLDQMAAPTASVSMNSQKITNLATPTASTDAVTKAYADALSQGLDFKESVRAVVTTNATLATAYENGDSAGGVTLATGDRILLAGQSSAAENGIYTVNVSGAPTRAVDADASGEISPGAVTYIEAGTYAGAIWICSATGATPWVPGSSTSTWTQFASVADLVAGAGLTKTGSTLDVGAGTGITVNANDVAVDTAVVVRKYATDIGNGSSTSIAVTHNLGTKDITWSARYVSTDAFVECDCVATSTTQATFTFAVAPTASQIRVVVHA